MRLRASSSRSIATIAISVKREYRTRVPYRFGENRKIANLFSLSHSRSFSWADGEGRIIRAGRGEDGRQTGGGGNGGIGRR